MRGGPVKAICLILVGLALPATTTAQGREDKLEERDQLRKYISLIELGQVLVVDNGGKLVILSPKQLFQSASITNMEDEQYDRWMEEKVTEPTTKKLKAYKSQLSQIEGELALDLTPEDLDLELEMGGTGSGEIDIPNGDAIGDLDDVLAGTDDSVDAVALRGSRFMVAGAYEMEITSFDGTYSYRLLVNVDECQSDPCAIEGSFKQRLRERWYFRGEVDGMRIRFRTLERGLDRRFWSFRGLIEGDATLNGSWENVDRDGRRHKGTWTATVKSD